MRGRLSISGLRFVGRTHGAPSLVRRSWPPRIDNPAGTWIAGAFISQRKQGPSRPSQPENGVRRSGSVISVEDKSVDDAFVELLKSRGVAYIPTVASGESYERV